MNSSKENNGSNKKQYPISGILYHNNKNKAVQEQNFNGFITIEGAQYNICAKYAGEASSGSPYFKIASKEDGQNIAGALFIESNPTERGPSIKAEVHLGDAHWKVSGFQKINAKGSQYLSLSERIVGAATATPPASTLAATPIPPKPAAIPSAALPAAPEPAGDESAGDPWAWEPEIEPEPAPQEAASEEGEGYGVNPFNFDNEPPSPEIASLIADLERGFDEADEANAA